MITLDRLWRAARFTASYADPLTSESEEDFEEGLDFQDQDETVEGIRRRLTDEAAVSRVGEALNNTLGADRDEEATPRDHFSPVQVRFPVNAPALRPPPPAEIVNEGYIVGQSDPTSSGVGEGNNPQPTMAVFEDENGVDDDKALSQALSLIKGFEWKPTNINFYFNQLETKMTTAGVKKNWTKFQVLTAVLPAQVQDELISTLQKSEADFPNNDAYKILKQKILKIFGQTEEARFERAMQRTLTGKPSQLARALVNDICDKELAGCCCSRAVATLWKQKIPLAVRQAVAHIKFTKENFDTIVGVADSVFLSSRPSGVTVAAVQRPDRQVLASSFQTPAEASAHDTAFIADNPADPVQAAAQSIVAAVQKFSKRGRGGRGGRGGQRGGGRGGGQGGGGQGGANNGGGSGGRWSHLKKSSDNPPSSVCKRHYVFGKSAHWCEEPASCPWKDYFTPKNK